ncbi:angiotensin-converting enzyme-like [Haemaphysalis longicornis]
MERSSVLVVWWLLVSAGRSGPQDLSPSEEAAELYLLRELESVQNAMCGESASALWNASVESSARNTRRLAETLQRYSALSLEILENVSRCAWPTFTNSTLRRAFSKLSRPGKYALDDESLARYLHLEAELSSGLPSVRVCQYKGVFKDPATDCHLTHSDIRRIYRMSKNYVERLHYFKEWTKRTRRFVLPFLEIVNVFTVESQTNGFSKPAGYMMSSYEWSSFREDTERLWNALLPLYEHVHAFARAQLVDRYGENHVSRTGPIQVHLLGTQGHLTAADMTGEMTTSPLGEHTLINPELANSTALSTFKLAESFYVSLGFPKLPSSFWEKSILERPSSSNTNFSCEPSAWDFCDGRDFRIRMCGGATAGDLQTALHEMGHVYYFMQYSHLPHVFRTGANPAFHEAVADALSWLAMRSPTFQRLVGLRLSTNDAAMQRFFELATGHVGTLFHEIATSTWLWKVLDEPSVHDQVDSLYWDMRHVPSAFCTTSARSLGFRMVFPNVIYWCSRLKYEGISPPAEHKKDHTYPPADYDFVAHVGRMKSMSSSVIQMQIIKFLCRAANHTGRLHECDIFGSKEAGKRLTEVLKLGSSKPFADVVMMITEDGGKMVDPSAILEYFEPVFEWLKHKNHHRHVGWTDSAKTV